MRDHRDEARGPAAPKLEEVAGTGNTADTRAAGTGEPRPLSEGEQRAVKATGAPAGALAGAAAGATAGLVTPLGPIGAGVGAILGAVAGAFAGGAGGVAAADDGAWTEEDERHYRALSEGGGGPADASYDRTRGAYQFGHLAARHPEYAGRDFHEVEPDLQARWHDELHRSVGEWAAVRPYVRDAYGHARASGAGVRRDAGVIGSAGSAVDPVELREARAADARLGGTATHADRASFSDPMAGTARAHSDAPGVGSPAWMREPVDQGGFGAHSHGSDRGTPGPRDAEPRAGGGPADEPHVDRSERARE